MSWDRIVTRVNGSKLREYLIDSKGLTLSKCIQKAKQHVSHHKQALKKGMSSSGDNLNCVRRDSKKTLCQTEPLGTVVTSALSAPSC